MRGLDMLHDVLRDRSAATSIEYGLILAAIAAALLAALTALAEKSTANFVSVERQAAEASARNSP